MPIYDYQCKSCNAIFDLSKKIVDRDDTVSDTCPECLKTGQIERLVGAPLVGYSTTTPGGYGRVSDGWKEVLKNINRKSGVKGAGTSSFL